MIAAISLAGCSSGSASSSAAPASASASASPAAQGATSTPTNAAENPLPSWAGALGAYTSVSLPQADLPGHSSPGQAVEGEFAELKAKNLIGVCSYMDPRTLATCKAQASQVPASDYSKMPYATNPAIGYSVIDGSEALVGTTGTFCTPTQTPECFTNTNPAAIFSAGTKTFSQLWNETVNGKSATTYSLTPADFVNGKWYVYGS